MNKMPWLRRPTASVFLSPRKWGEPLTLTLSPQAGRGDSQRPPGVRVRSSQRGLALITAVLIVAIVATIAASLSLGQQIWLRQAQNFNDRAQADKVAQAALQWAILILKEDAKNHPATDDLTEDWAKQLPPLPVDGGAVTGKITDAQGRFNLNNLMRGNTQSQPDVVAFGQLLQSLKLSNSTQLTDALLDWLDNDGAIARPGGAEDIYYLTLSPPYRAANQPLESVDELRLVRGFDAQTVELLRRHVSALPGVAPVNVNTADALVLQSLFAPGFPLSTAEQLVSDRDKEPKNPFKTLADLEQRAGQKPVATNIDVKSEYFYVQIDTKFGRLQRSRQALVHRAPGNPIDILWQVNLLGLPAAAEESRP